MAKTKEEIILQEASELKTWVIIELKNWIAKLYEDNYKLNQNDYIIEWEWYKVVNKDIKDIRPYVRYLSNNKKEKFRHSIIMYMWIWVLLTLFLVYGMKWDISKIKKSIENNTWSLVENSVESWLNELKENAVKKNLELIIPNTDSWSESLENTYIENVENISIDPELDIWKWSWVY